MANSNLPKEPYYIYLSSPSDSSIKIASPDGEFLGSISIDGGIPGPDGLVIGDDGNLYVSTVVGASVLKFNPITGEYLGELVSQKAFFDAASNDFGLDLGSATGITLGPDGNFYVSNLESKIGISTLGQPIINFDIQDSILVFDGETGSLVKTILIPYGDADNINFEGTISDFFAQRSQEGLPFQGVVTKAAVPVGLAFGDDGNLYISTRLHDAVYRYELESGTISPFATEASGLDGPIDILQSPDSNWYVTSLDNNKILRFSSSGEFLDILGDYGNQSSLVDGPTAIEITPDQESFLVTFYNTANAVQIDAASGDIEKILIPPSPEFGFFRNEGLLIANPSNPISQDSLFVASVNNFAIVDYQPDKAGTDGYSDLGFKKVYTPGLSTINRYNTDGSFNSTFVPAGLEDANITVASGLTFGPDGLFYINDQGANSVKKFDLSGNFQGYFLNGTAPDTPEEVVIGQDGINDYSLYVSSLTGDGVKRYDFETGALIDHIAFIPGTTTPLSAALMEFDQDGNLYIGGVFSTSQVIKYDPDTQQVETFIPTDTAQLIPSGIAFDGEGNLYNGTFSGPTFGLPNTTIAQYNSGGNLLDSNYVDNSSGELDISSRVRLFDLDGNGTKEFYVSNFGGSSIMKYLGPDENTPGASEGAYISDAVSGGSLSNPGGLIFVQGEASAEINFIPANPGSNLGSLTYNSGDTTAVSVVQQALDQTDALFDNLIGLYRVANDQGAVFDIYDSNSNGSTEDLLNPGDFGYAVTALSQYEANVLLRLGAEGDAAKNTTAAQFGDVLINGGQYYAPFVIANGGNLLASGDTLADGIAKFLETNLLNTGATLDNFLTHEVAYFSFGAANPDGTEHLQSFGNNIFGFEDLPGNLDVSDFDFNDTVFEFSFA